MKTEAEWADGTVACCIITVIIIIIIIIIKSQWLWER